MSFTREAPLQPRKAALLVIDVQNYCCKPGFGLLKSDDVHGRYLVKQVSDVLVPSTKKLLDACREHKNSINVIYTYIECLTQDGRDQSLDYKITGFVVPKDSEGAKIIDEIAPTSDEILLPKTACSVFNSTTLDYILRNLGVTQLVVSGIVTNQCVESAVRDAADLGFLVTLVEDACAAHSPEEHQSALHNLKGFSRIVTHEKVVAEINSWDLTLTATNTPLTREVALIPKQSALLVVDLQEYCRMPEDLERISENPENDGKVQYMLNRLTSMILPTTQKLLKACRAKRGKIEVLYTVVECLTKDCRDQSLDYLISKIQVPKGSPAAKVMHEIAPEEDEIVIPKSACSVFNSTNIEYILRNLGVSQLVVAGMITNQCVESAVRDAADRGFLVTLVKDACVAYSEAEHQSALHNLKGFSRIVTADLVVSELADWK